MYEGHISRRVVRTTRSKLPYKVVMVPAVVPGTESRFATMREAEEFIRRHTRVPARVLSDLHDRAPGET